jgi:hypothetical protein
MENQGFQKIGDLTKSLTKSVSVRDTPMMKSTGLHRALQTTGVETDNSKNAGTEPSTIGSVRTLLAGQFERGERDWPSVATKEIKVLLNSHSKPSAEIIKLVFDAALPMSGNDMAQELAKLSVLTKRRNDGDIDTKLLIAAYAEKLNDYPADVVRFVLKGAANQNKFFPAWAELYEHLEFWGRDRMELRDKVIERANETIR